MQIMSQSSGSAPSTLTRILVKRLFDPYSFSIIEDKEILVDEVSGIILAVNDLGNSADANVDVVDEWYSADAKNAKVIDLTNAQLVLPGLVDTHVHCTLRRTLRHIHSRYCTTDDRA